MANLTAVPQENGSPFSGEPVDLKQLVQELLGQDKAAGTVDKEIKTAKARYHQLILRNPEKTYSDTELMAIKAVHNELCRLQDQKAGFQQQKAAIKDYLKNLVEALDGGRWVHETDDFMNPCWEFWIEEGELKYTRLKSEN